MCKIGSNHMDVTVIQSTAQWGEFVGNIFFFFFPPKQTSENNNTDKNKLKQKKRCAGVVGSPRAYMKTTPQKNNMQYISTTKLLTST